MVGITGFGAYIPKLRLKRESIVDANKWLNPGIASLAKGERSMSNWDEDPITLGVEAARDCLSINERSLIENIYFASTTNPFADRQNATIVATALSLNSNIMAIPWLLYREDLATYLPTYLQPTYLPICLPT